MLGKSKVTKKYTKRQGRKKNLTHSATDSVFRKFLFWSCQKNN